MKPKKVVTATDEEVARYGAQNAPEGAGAPASEPPPGGEAPPAADAAPRSEADEWKDKCLRAKAELLNFQRRAEKDRSDALKYANASLVRALLPVLDDLERTVSSTAASGDNAGALADGAKLTLSNFHKVLREFQIEPIESVGQPFDPQVHEALMQQPSADYPAGTVLQETAKGYRLFDRVLRPAKVIVSIAVQSPTETGGGEHADV